MYALYFSSKWQTWRHWFPRVQLTIQQVVTGLDNGLALNKLLYESMMVKFTDSYLCHSAWVNQDHPCYWYTVRCHYSTVNFLTSIHRGHHIACPLRWGMGVSFVDSASDWYFASVPAIIYATSDYIGLPYNGIQLHMENIYPFFFKW